MSGPQTKCVNCGAGLSPKIPWCTTCGEEKGFVPHEPRRNVTPYVIAVIIGPYGGWSAFLSPTRDSPYGLFGYILLLAAIGLIVNDLYSREIAGRDS